MDAEKTWICSFYRPPSGIRRLKTGARIAKSTSHGMSGFPFPFCQGERKHLNPPPIRFRAAAGSSEASETARVRPGAAGRESRGESGSKALKSRRAKHSEARRKAKSTRQGTKTCRRRGWAVSGEFPFLARSGPRINRRLTGRNATRRRGSAGRETFDSALFLGQVIKSEYKV